MAFYHTYRPQNFADVVGQPHITTTLQNAILTGAIPHALLFTGSRGIGKTSIARIFAKAINCTGRTPGSPEPCQQCIACTSITEGRSLDLMEIDAASHRGIDEIRSLQEKVRYTTTQLTYKIYIIDEVHMLTTEAFNALLKTLEEPPANVVFVLATTDPQKVPETVISRCMRFDYRRISVDQLVDHLLSICTKEHITAERDALALLARQAKGGVRDALGLLEHMVAYGSSITTSLVEETLGLAHQEGLQQILQGVFSKDRKLVLSQIRALHEKGYDFVQCTDALLEILRCITIMYINPADTIITDLPEGQRTFLTTICKETSLGSTQELFTFFFTAKQQFSIAPLPEIPFELACLRAISFIEQGTNVQLPKPVVPITPPVQSPPQTKPLIPYTPPAQKSWSPEMGNARTPTNTYPRQNPRPGFSSTPPVVSAPPETPAHDPYAWTLESVGEHWQELLTTARRRNASLEAVLRSCAPVALDAGSLTIGAKYGFHRDRIMEAVNKETVSICCKEIFGVTVALSCEVIPTIVPPTSMQAKRRTAQEGVQKILSVFPGGTVISSPSSTATPSVDAVKEAFGVQENPT